MLRSLKDLERCTVSASDGDVGSVANFLLDDERWTIRYLVIDTSNWWFGKKVLIAPPSGARAQPSLGSMKRLSTTTTLGPRTGWARL